MARGKKNSPALFEVIRNAQQKQKEQLERQKQQELAAEANAANPAASLLGSPMLWLKGKKAHQAAVDKGEVAVDVEPTPVFARTPIAPAKTVEKPVFTKPEKPLFREVPAPQPAAAAASREVIEGEEVVEDDAPSTPFVVSKPAPPRYTPPAPAPMSAAEIAARQVREEIAAQEAPAAEPMFAGTDYHKPYASEFDAEDEDAPKHLNLQFTYTTAIVAAFAVMVTFVVAYIIGTSGSKAGEQIATNTQAKRPDVLNVQPTNGKAAGNTVTPAPAPVDPTPVDNGARASLPTDSNTLSLETLGKPIPVPTNVKRVIGRQYLVLLSFPRAEDAKELVKFLAQNGVPATAETALPDYAKSWTSVVTTRGFEHTRNNPEFTAYSSMLEGLLKKYAGPSKFKKFNIDVYTWRAAR